VSEPKSPASSPTAHASVRLKVAYKNAETLMGEFNRSVGQGRVAIESRKRLPLGTRFILELYAVGVSQVVEVVGEVVEVVPLHEATDEEHGRFMLGLTYDAGPDRRGVEAVLTHIFAAQSFEKMRRYPRILLNLKANEELTDSTPIIIRDLSRGGVGLVVDLPGLPSDIEVGAPFWMGLRIADFALELRGEVAWALTPRADKALWFNPAFGVSFFAFDAATGQKLDRLLTHNALPKAPWKAKVRVGPEAL